MAINDIKNAWAFYHSVAGACSRDDWVCAVNATRKAIETVTEKPKKG